MTSVSGTMKLGEADATRRDIARRYQMGGTEGYFLLLAMVLAGAAAGALIWRAPGMAIGVACAFIAYWGIANRFALKRFRTEMVARGLPAEFPVEMALTPETLTYHVGDVQHIAKWSAVTEIFASRGFWLFMVDSAAWALPGRLFADKAAERAFIAAALEHLSDAARERSRSARALVATA
jgi:hypothetical protein